MTKEDFKIDIDNMYHLIAAVYMDYKLVDKTFPYDNLLSQIDTYKMSGTPFSPKYHKIDDFMVDVYKIYNRYSTIKDKLGEIMSMTGLGDIFGMNEDIIKSEFSKISQTFEDIMIHCDFEGVQIRGIQINFLKDVMKNAIKDENYELAAKLRDKLKTI